jgi:ubiquinone/menaquinone biosynthesis C-methylase UbiE
MSHYEETFSTWNKIAQLYEDKFMGLNVYDETYDFFCKTLAKQNAKILEVGCGPGNITKHILDQRADFDILGIDVAPNMIKLAQKNNPKVNFKVMDARAIYELNAQFDGIIAGFCIPYFSPKETKQFISSANQLLHDDGVLYISFVEGEDAQSGLKSNTQGDKVHFYYHQLATVAAEITNLGFKELHIFNVDFQKSASETELHTIIITKK